MLWSLVISDTSLDSRLLGDLLAELDIAVFQYEGRTEITSPSWDQVQTADEIWEIAKRLGDAIKPVLASDTLQFAFIREWRNEAFVKNHSFWPTASLVATGHMTATGFGLPPAHFTDEQKAEWIAAQVEQRYQSELREKRTRLKAAYHDERAQKVMEILSEDVQTGLSLFKIYELIKGTQGTAKFHAQFHISNDDFDRFRDAVHNPAVHGDFARHAIPGPPRTTNPMTQDEAISFVTDLANAWFKTL